MTRFILLLIVAAGFAFSSCNDLGTKKEYNGVELYYKGDVTETEADALGVFLKETGFSDGSRKTIQLLKNGSTYEMHMVVIDGYQDKEDWTASVSEYAGMISDNVFKGASVEMHLCDENMKTLKVLQMTK
jgi:hypothetical protein